MDDCTNEREDEFRAVHLLFGVDLEWGRVFEGN